MSLGATMAWTICMNRAGIWIVHPTLVFFTVASTIILSLSAILESFLTFDCLRVSLVGEVLPLKCKGTREYVRKTPSLPLARKWRGFTNVALHLGLNWLGNFTLIAFCCGAVAKFVPCLVASCWTSGCACYWVPVDPVYSFSRSL